MLEVRGPVEAIDEYVVEKEEDQCVHRCQEGRRQGSRAEGHNIKFIMVIACPEGRGFNRLWGYWCLVEAGAKVQLCVESRSLELAEQFIYCWNRRSITDGNIVEHSIVPSLRGSSVD